MFFLNSMNSLIWGKNSDQKNDQNGSNSSATPAATPQIPTTLNPISVSTGTSQPSNSNSTALNANDVRNIPSLSGRVSSSLSLSLSTGTVTSSKGSSPTETRPTDSIENNKNDHLDVQPIYKELLESLDKMTKEEFLKNHKGASHKGDNGICSIPDNKGNLWFFSRSDDYRHRGCGIWELSRYDSSAFRKCVSFQISNEQGEHLHGIVRDIPYRTTAPSSLPASGSLSLSLSNTPDLSLTSSIANSSSQKVAQCNPFLDLELQNELRKLIGEKGLRIGEEGDKFSENDPAVAIWYTKSHPMLDINDYTYNVLIKGTNEIISFNFLPIERNKDEKTFMVRIIKALLKAGHIKADDGKSNIAEGPQGPASMQLMAPTPAPVIASGNDHSYADTIYREVLENLEFMTVDIYLKRYDKHGIAGDNSLCELPDSKGILWTFSKSKGFDGLFRESIPWELSRLVSTKRVTLPISNEQGKRLEEIIFVLRGEINPLSSRLSPELSYTSVDNFIRRSNGLSSASPAKVDHPRLLPSSSISDLGEIERMNQPHETEFRKDLIKLIGETRLRIGKEGDKFSGNDPAVAIWYEIADRRINVHDHSYNVLIKGPKGNESTTEIISFNLIGDKNEKPFIVRIKKALLKAGHVKFRKEDYLEGLKELVGGKRLKIGNKEDTLSESDPEVAIWSETSHGGMYGCHDFNYRVFIKGTEELISYDWKYSRPNKGKPPFLDGIKAALIRAGHIQNDDGKSNAAGSLASMQLNASASVNAPGIEKVELKGNGDGIKLGNLTAQDWEKIQKALGRLGRQAIKVKDQLAAQEFLVNTEGNYVVFWPSSSSPNKISYQIAGQEPDRFETAEEFIKELTGNKQKYRVRKT